MTDADLTINEWCAKRNYSRSTFYALKRAGRAPDTLEVLPGCPRITVAADLAWEEARRAEQRKVEA